MFDFINRTECPVCNAEDRILIGIRPGDFVKEDFNVWRCVKCDCVYVENPIHPRHLPEIYNEEYFSGKGLDGTVNYLENLSRQKFFFEKYDFQIGAQIKQYRPKPGCRWLDIGCALGNVLDWAKVRYGAETFGIEPSKYARDIAGKKGHRIIGSLTEHVDFNRYENYFDVVSAYEVLEHLYEPMSWMSGVERLLKKGGVFHYSTGAPPKDRKILTWSYLRPEVHITFYSPRCMRKLFSLSNLRCNKRKAYYWGYSFKHYRPRRRLRGWIYQVIANIGLDVFDRYQPDAIKPE